MVFTEKIDAHHLLFTKYLVKKSQRLSMNNLQQGVTKQHLV